MQKSRPCKCGCGQKTQYTFVRGHASKLRARDGKGNRRCPQCRKWKPETAEYFCRAGKRAFASLCKPCHVERGTRNRQISMQRDPAVRDRYRAKWRADAAIRRRDDPGRYLQIRQRSSQRLRTQLVDAYGGQCSCCGETEFAFLTLEHVNNDGAVHRARLKTGGGEAVWRDLRDRGWPQEGYTILCWNCHMATCRGLPCPHEVKS